MDRLRKGLIAGAMALLLAAPAYAFKEGSQNCLTCHNLSQKEAASILEKLNMPAAKVVSVGMSPVKGLWEISVENNHRFFVVYVDFARKLVTPGPFIDFASKKDLTKEKIDALNKDRAINVQGLALQNALTIGKPDAPVKIIVFTDPDCPFCAKLHAELKTVAAKRPDIVFYLKLFAIISRNPKTAKNIVCSRSLSVLEDAFQKKAVPDQECDSKEIDENMEFAKQQGLDEAPALVLPDGTLQVGWLDAASLEKRIDEAVKNPKKQAPKEAVK